MKALLTSFALLFFLSCKKDSDSSGDINGTWSVDTYTVRYYDASGKVVSDYNSLPALKKVVIEGDSLTFDNFTPPVACPYSIGKTQSEQNGTLPVDFLSFNAKFIENKVTISWTTASEINNSHFELLMSSDAAKFEEIARVSGTNSSFNPYSFKVTESLYGNYYFKLKQVDFNGLFSHSNVVLVAANKTKVPLSGNGEKRLVLLPRSFAPFRSADITRTSADAVTLFGEQNNVTFVKNGSVSNADHAEIKIVFKKN